MGVGFIIGAIVVAALGAVAIFFRPGANESTTNDMSPNTMESFAITTTKEGTVVRLTYGRTRGNGNMIWYGNLVVEEVTAMSEVVSGGKGGGGGGTATQVTGHNYFMDVWQVVCIGQASLEKVYLSDGEIDLTEHCDSYSWNDGTQDTYPTEPGETAAALPGIAHIFIKKLFLGFNVSTVPTLHFVTNRIPVDVPFANVVETNGINPAAIIYDLLKRGGATDSEINVILFNAAAIFWHDEGYGLNMSFSAIKKAKDCIELALSFVGGYFTLDNDNKYGLKALDPDEASSVTISETKDGNSDCISVRLKRKTWDDTWNVFNGKYSSEDLNETERVVTTKNSASIALLGVQKPKAIDLTGFRDQDSAMKRLTEIMKRESYPSSDIEIDVFLDFLGTEIGSIMTFNSETYGITNGYYRVTNKDITNIDENKITLSATQVIERLHSSVFTAPTYALHWTVPDYTPVALDNIEIIELPRNPITQTEKYAIVLAERKLGVEDGLIIFESPTGTDYLSKKVISTFSQRGILQESYPSTTLRIDDTLGILYNAVNEDPKFDSISRTALFSGVYSRLGFIGTEIIGFQTVTYEGDDIRLTGVVRGLFNTPIGAYNTGQVIWLTTASTNALSIADATSSMYYKCSPKVFSNAVDLSLIVAKHVNYTNKAKTPWPIGHIKATRVGSDISFEWFPTGFGNSGAGTASEVVNTSPNPPAIGASTQFEYYTNYDTTKIVVTNTTATLSYASSMFFYILIREGAYDSTSKSVYVGAADGEYYGY